MTTSIPSPPLLYHNHLPHHHLPHHHLPQPPTTNPQPSKKNQATTLTHKQDWTSSLIPHLKLISSDPSLPHPKTFFRYTVQPQHCNRLGNLHGGCIATLFDYCTTMPLALVSKPGFWYYLGVSRNINTTYLRPIPVGTEIFIECEVVAIGKRLASLSGKMRRAVDGALLATCEHGKVNTDPEAGGKL